MSSSTATLLPLSPTDGSGETAGASHGLNYFYGFLLTSVGLLVIFIVCGIGSRQRFTSRRVNYALETGRSLNDKLEGGETPQFYEPLFVTGEDKWSGLMPLSVRCFREKESDSIAHDLEAAPPPTPARPNISGQVFSWFNNNPSLQTQAYSESPDTIQVAVMIIMPSRNVSPKNPQGPPEYEIGEISLPWHDDPQPNP